MPLYAFLSQSKSVSVTRPVEETGSANLLFPNTVSLSPGLSVFGSTVTGSTPTGPSGIGSAAARVAPPAAGAAAGFSVFPPQAAREKSRHDNGHGKRRLHGKQDDTEGRQQCQGDGALPRGAPLRKTAHGCAGGMYRPRGSIFVKRSRNSDPNVTR